MKAVSLIWRGLGHLPHVGEHPGTLFVLGWIAIAVAAGAQRGGAIGAVVGGTFMLFTMGPMYLYGAYDRAKLSDRLSFAEK